MTFPPDLEHLLPARLWHRLTAEAPRRGVLLNALDRLRSILYLLSTYLPSHLVQEKMRRPVPDLVRGQMLSGSLLFADVSGFTALSEQLASLKDGAEQLTDLTNRYFDKMLTILSRSGGILLKFAGDALLAYYPEQEGDGQAQSAVRAGQRMMEAMTDFAAIETPLGTVGLRMKIGVGSGRFLAASVGSVERMEYIILGETVARTMAAEGVAQAGQIITDGGTAAHMQPSCCVEQAPGFFAAVADAAEELDDYEITIDKRRARGAIPWSASPHAIITQMEIALRQIKALTPFLPPDLLQRIVTSALERQVASEYRPATVLFVNFVGLETLLTAWGEGGVRQVTRLLDEYFRTMQRAITRHGGIISRIDPYSQGSKMLVLFGAPVAHEEQPLRAVSAALAMNAELAALNDRWRGQLERQWPDLQRESPREGGGGPCPTGQNPPPSADLGAPLIQQRIGITRGHTFAGQAGSLTRREYTVMGDDVNLAARLMAAAQPGQILLSQHVYDAVADYFSAIALSPIRVKGKSRPIPIYQPTGLRDDPLARRLRGRGHLAGREIELEQGWAAIRQTLNNKGRILVIQGPVGVGKSHLADEVVSYALARGFKVLFSACRSYAANAAYAPWISLLQSLVGIAPADPASPRSGGQSFLENQTGSEKLRRTLSDLGLLAVEYTDPLANLLGLPGSLLRDASPGLTPVEGHPAARQAGARRGASLFARLGKKVAEQDKADLDLWQLIQKRPPVPTQDRQGQMPAPGVQAQVWHNLQGRVAARQQGQLFGAVCGLLTRLSVETPLLIFFESAQWMDPASRALISFLGEQLQQLPILALVVQREETTADTGGEDTLTLGPLDQKGTAAMVSRLLGQEAEAGLAEIIHHWSGGNPFFVEEIVRWLQRSGRNTLSVDGLRDGVQASTTLQELVLSRLDSLPPGQRDTAKLASIVGNEFPCRAVRALLPPTIDGEALGAYLAGLEEARLILLTEAGRDARYAFRQPLVQEVAYGSQPFARRRELHAKLAAYLEICYAGDMALQAEVLAHHYELAEQPLPAARYLLLSGDKARHRYAYPQAAETYKRALTILECLLAEGTNAETKALQTQIHEGLGDTALLTGDFVAAAAEYDAARIVLAPEIPSRLLVKLAQANAVVPTQDQTPATPTAGVYARQAWAAREAATELAAAATLAWLLWRAGDAEAGNWIERCQTLAARNDDPWTSGIAALMADLAGDWSRAQQAYLSLGRPVGVALAACRQGGRYLQEGDTAGAQALYEQAVELWEQEDDACGLALGRYCQAGAYLQCGDDDAARSALQEALDLLETAPTAIQDDRLLIRRALAAVEAGQAEPWSPWQWQCYDDAFRISMLFRVESPGLTGWREPESEVDVMPEQDTVGGRFRDR